MGTILTPHGAIDKLMSVIDGNLLQIIASKWVRYMKIPPSCHTTETAVHVKQSKFVWKNTMCTNDVRQLAQELMS